MELEVKTLSGGAAGKHAVGFELVENCKGSQAVHDTVVAYLAAQRLGTAKTKNRGEVSGTGKKPWRQKGTGRARTGSRRTNIFTGGGVTHGPRPRDFSKKVNTKTRQLALRKALSERLKDGEVIVVESLQLDTHKTAALQDQINTLLPEEAKTVLIVTDQPDRNLQLAARNLNWVELTEAQTLNTYQALRPDVLLVSQDALAQVAERLKAQ